MLALSPEQASLPGGKRPKARSGASKSEGPEAQARTEGAERASDTDPSRAIVPGPLPLPIRATNVSHVSHLRQTDLAWTSGKVSRELTQQSLAEKRHGWFALVNNIVFRPRVVRMALSRAPPAPDIPPIGRPLIVHARPSGHEMNRGLTRSCYPLQGRIGPLAESLSTDPTASASGHDAILPHFDQRLSVGLSCSPGRGDKKADPADRQFHRHRRGTPLIGVDSPSKPQIAA